VLALALLFGGLAWAHHARAESCGDASETPPEEQERVLWIDPAAAEVALAPQWADPRWLGRVRTLAAEEPPFPAHEPGPLVALANRLATLSFVERVERCAAGPEGLELELVLREPVACIPAAGAFALVDSHGVVLEGRWPLPPRLGRAFLPVLGPLDDPLLARARAGDWLVEPEHADALDVARSLAAHLDEDERARLGRIVIDARCARRTSVSEPGVRLELEGGRVALFGRAPAADEPGELAPRSKWRALVRAHELFARDPVGADWSLVDLRWDRPDIALRSGPELAALASAPRAAPGTTAGARGPTRVARARGDGRPRVR
jgi:hypothetical protein